jgi:RimJ/RimL family protein N-acetyltransferase
MAAIEVELGILVEASDSHFAWMLGEAPAPTPQLRLPPDGVDAPDIVRLLRNMARRLRTVGSRNSWLVVADNEIVGLCGYKQPPAADGKVEIGYGITESRRNQGHATRAVSAMLVLARRDPSVSTVVAATSVDNIASQTVLERNGFERTGMSDDPDDGRLIWWRGHSREF